MYHQFNIQQSYVLPTHCIYVFCVDLRTDAVCLLRGKDRVSNSSSCVSLPVSRLYTPVSHTYNFTQHSTSNIECTITNTQILNDIPYSFLFP
jgi:hypothetical protein